MQYDLQCGEEARSITSSKTCRISTVTVMESMIDLFFKMIILASYFKSGMLARLKVFETYQIKTDPYKP